MNKLYSLALVLLLSACSATQVRLDTQLQPTNSPALYQLQSTVKIKASNATPSTLKENTTWSKVGAIEQGIVYKTKDQVVIVNSFDVHEGYIVVNDGKVVGYYLPVEKSFVAVTPKPISLEKMEN